MRKRNKKFWIITIVAAAVAAVFIYIVIILVSNNNKQNTKTKPAAPDYNKIILRQNVPIELDGRTIEEVCSIIATMIINDAGYASTYIPVKTEVFTGKNSDFYSKVCKKQQFTDENSYDALMYNHYSKQAEKMTEIVKTYKNGRRTVICIWGYSDNFWETMISDYDFADDNHRENIKFMCDIGAVLLDKTGKINPKTIADELFLEGVFNRLKKPESLLPACCFKINDDIPTVGVGDTDSYIAMWQVNKWLVENVGITNRFISFDLNGADLSVCFSTEDVGLLCWPLSFCGDAVFSFDTGKYNEPVIKKLLEFCFYLAQAITGCDNEENRINNILSDIQKENFEGIVLSRSGKNGKALEISVFQIDINGIRIQLKSEGGNNI